MDKPQPTMADVVKLLRILDDEVPFYEAVPQVPVFAAMSWAEFYAWLNSVDAPAPLDKPS